MPDTQALQFSNFSFIFLLSPQTPLLKNCPSPSSIVRSRLKIENREKFNAIKIGKITFENRKPDLDLVRIYFQVYHDSKHIIPWPGRQALHSLPPSIVALPSPNRGCTRTALMALGAAVPLLMMPYWILAGTPLVRYQAPNN